MVFIGYALFITVFNQIISQNEGFFYAIVFGGILILLYIFINIICKLMDVSDQMRYKNAFKILYTLVVAAACGLFCYFRIRYRSVLVPSETVFYQSAVLINNNAISVSKNLIEELLANPSEYVMALLYSLILGFTDNSNIIVIVNLFFCCLTTIFVYLISSRFTDNFCAVIAALISLFAPGQMFCVYSYNTDCMFASLFFADIHVLVELIFAEKKAKRIVLCIVYSVLSALLLLCEPTMIILLIFTVMLVPYTKPERIKHVLFTTFIAMFLFIGLLYFKSLNLQVSLDDVVDSTVSCFTLSGSEHKNYELKEIKESFDSYICADDRNIEENYSYLVNDKNMSIQPLTAAWIMLGNQMVFMFILVLGISGVFTSLQYKDKRFACLFIMLISACITMYISPSRDVNTYYYHSILSILSSCGLFYIYLNHHQDEAIAFKNKINNIVVENIDEGLPSLTDEELIKQHEDFMLRAYALIFVGENNNLYNMIKTEEKCNRLPDHQEEVNIIEDAEFVELGNYNQSAESVINQDYIPVSESNNVTEASGYKENLPDAGENIIDNSENNVSAVTYIPNPLPVPVKKPHTGLDYDYDLKNDDSDSDWDFDINDSDLDDFDY